MLTPNPTPTTRTLPYWKNTTTLDCMRSARQRAKNKKKLYVKSPPSSIKHPPPLPPPLPPLPDVRSAPSKKANLGPYLFLSQSPDNPNPDRPGGLTRADKDLDLIVTHKIFSAFLSHLLPLLLEFFFSFIFFVYYLFSFFFFFFFIYIYIDVCIGNSVTVQE